MECSIIEKAVITSISRFRIPPGSRILDAPCGKGALVSALSDLGFSVFGTDVDPSSASLLNDRFRTADLNTALPWPDNHFDVVCSVEGIEHLENPHRYLRELHRVLNPSGWLILTTPNIISLRSRVRFFGSSFFHKDPLPLNESARHPLHHIGLRPLHLLRYDLHTTGFQIDRILCTHLKAVSLPYLIFAPWMWLYTAVAFRKEKDKAQRDRNRDIRKAMFSRAVLLGENLLIVARKRGTAN